MRKVLTFILAAGIWIGCGYVARGYWIGYFTTSFPDQEHERDSNVTYLFGPFALAGEAAVGAFSFPYMQHGYTCQQRYAVFKNRVSSLDKTYFVTWGGNQLCKAEDLK